VGSKDSIRGVLRDERYSDDSLMHLTDTYGPQQKSPEVVFWNQKESKVFEFFPPSHIRGSAHQSQSFTSRNLSDYSGEIWKPEESTATTNPGTSRVIICSLRNQTAAAGNTASLLPLLPTQPTTNILFPYLALRALECHSSPDHQSSPQTHSDHQITYEQTQSEISETRL
jgi:hypothetical protein